MSFASPLLLVCLLAVPAAVAGLVLLERERRRRARAWAPAALLPNMTTRPSSLRRHLPTALLLVGLALLVVGFARPKASFHVRSQEATLVLVLDVSGSMAANDARPTRFAVAKQIARRFIDKAPKGYRLALVTFSDHVAVAAAPTHDFGAVRGALARAHTGPQGTALADAIVRAVRLGTRVPGTSQGRRPPAVVVVISDGGQTAGGFTPQQAAQRALQARIPVSSILVGTPDGIVQQKLQGGFTERIQVPAQPQVLQAISRAALGHFTSAPAAVDVAGTYDELGSRTGKRKKTIEVSAAAAAGGLAFMLAGGILSGVWFRRMP
ncbi:MAG TPA: VWA domain-containing protein [Gaiellaceae bacterium]|nr:VWA domain-containing protein [Gaiellaceae bacterium]